MPWIVPLNRLGEQQSEVLDSILRGGDSHWIRGFAGSGKSVILVHSLREALARNPAASACIVVFTHALRDMLRSGLTDELKRRIPIETYFQFKRSPRFYDLVFVDEVQDIPVSVVRLLKRHAGRLIVAGDEVQSIYEEGVSPEELKSTIHPTTHRLSVIYRLTEKLKQIVSAILPDANLGGARMGRLVAEVKVSLGTAQDYGTEAKWVWDQAKRFAKLGEPSAILFSKHDYISRFLIHIAAIHGLPWPAISTRRGVLDYTQVNEWLASHGVPLRYLGNNHGSLEDGDRTPLVYLMTYHSSKGLDFETVFLPGLDSQMKIGGKSHLARPAFFVASTRSRRNLFLTYSGPAAHEFVRAIPQHLVDKFECRLAEVAGDGDEDDIF